jgi:ABC-type multidrug transport system fused ATPase/permease subunit
MKHQFYKTGILALIVAAIISLTAFTPFSRAAEDIVNIYFFYSQTCPHCIKQKPLMRAIDDNDRVDVRFFEVSENPEIWSDFREKHQITSGAVPRTFIGNRSFVGYSESNGELEYIPTYQGYIGYKNQILNAIEQAVGTPLNLPDLNASAISNKIPLPLLFIPIAYLFTYPLLAQKLNSEATKRYWWGGFGATLLLSLFFTIALTPDTVIQEFARALPFPLFVFAIALSDGFNPCAFTVLIILLSLLTYTKSKKDMSIIGGTFIAASAVMYFIFIILMVLVGSVFLETYEIWFVLLLGIILAIAGAINIKDYFFFKRSISLSLTDKQQAEVSQRAGTIVRELRAAQNNTPKFLAALGGTILLAIFVNLIELGCTAILPAVYMTRLLNYCANNIGVCSFGWTALYSLIYIIPLLGILLNFIYSFKSTRLTEQQGRILKLFSGLLMLFFGLVMMFEPQFLTLR